MQILLIQRLTKSMQQLRCKGQVILKLKALKRRTWMYFDLCAGREQFSDSYCSHQQHE